VSFSPPSSDGGSLIRSYTVTVTPDPSTGSGSLDILNFTSGDVVAGLTNGSTYSFTVTATNDEGTSPASSPAATATPFTVPDAPTAFYAVAGNGSAYVVINTPPASNGNPIIQYVVTINPAPASGSATVISPVGGYPLPIDITGLTNGISYTFTVAAENDAGIGNTSLPSSPVTPSTIPSPPTGVSAVPAGSGTVVVSWGVPVSNGGQPITGYQISTDGGNTWGPTGGITALTETITGLTNGTSYNIQVRALNDHGEGNASASATVTPSTVPDAPIALTAVPGDGQVALSWTAPTYDGSNAITGYAIIVDGSTKPINTPTTATTFTVTGLTNGTSYTFQVAAINANGSGGGSDPATATPSTVPGAPTSLTATAGNGQVALSWTAPSDNGGSAITGYTVTINGTPTPIVGTATTYTVTGLTNGTTYTFVVAATNTNGTGANSNSVSATPGTVPDAPTGLTATAGNGQVVLSWTAPASDGGNPITDYAIVINGSATPISTGSTATSYTATGLTNGTSYSFQVVAINAIGSSAASTAATATPIGPVLITTTTLPNATTTVAYNAGFTSSGSPAPTWSVSSGSLPPGLSLDPTTGAITGTPTQRGSFTFTITADNGNPPAPSQTFTLVVDVPVTPVYPVVNDFGTWTGTGTATAYISADYEKFWRLTYADYSTPVSPANYTTAPGSIYITFTEAYLQTLPNGTYYYVAEFTDGDTREIYLIVANSNSGGGGGGGGGSGLPASGDTSGTLVTAIVILAVVAVALIAAALVIRHRRRSRSRKGE